ncbi:hypothetical protein L7F22_067258 [Adiantum nelumboides]|nr:hypothetical protein [Adiantum nelumboides]
METSPQKETAKPLKEIDKEKQPEGEQHQPTKVDVSILMVQDEEPSIQEAILEVRSFDYTKIIQTLTRQFQCQQVVARETEIQKTRANQAEEEMANLRTALELSQLTRKEAQNHELIKNEKKMKEQIKYEDVRYQKLNTSYNTVKNTLTALLQNQEPAAEAPSTLDSAALNTLAALHAELQTEKLQRQLLVSGFMSQTAQHEARVKQLEEELAKAKADLQAVGSLASTSHIQQAETHELIQPPQLPEMPEFQGIEEEEQQRPAPGALDIREEIEQEVEDLPEGPAKEYLMYEKKVMQSAALAFLQPEEQIKDFGTDFLPLSLMRHEAILWKEKMRPMVQRNEDGGYEGISLTTEEAKTLIEDHPRRRLPDASEDTQDDRHLHPADIACKECFLNIPVHSKEEQYHVLVRCQFIEVDKRKEAKLILNLDTTNEEQMSWTEVELQLESRNSQGPPCSRIFLAGRLLDEKDYVVEGAMKVPPFFTTKDKILEADKHTRDLDTDFAKVRETLQKSQERQKKAAERHRRDLKLKENDWITEQIKDISFRLRLPDTWKIHNVFHVNLWKTFGDVPDDGEPGEQPEVEENEEILVPEQVLAQKVTKKGKAQRQFLIKFKNFPAFDAKWMEEEDLADTPQILKLYLEAFGLA